MEAGVLRAFTLVVAHVGDAAAFAVVGELGVFFDLVAEVVQGVAWTFF